MTLRTSSSHEEGCDRDWAILTKEFIGENGKLVGLKTIRIQWEGRRFEEVEGTEEVIPCNLALLAAGFVHPQKVGMIEQLGLELDERGNVKADDFRTSAESIYAAGDMRRGQSLVVWAISEGREAAKVIDHDLMGRTTLEAKDSSLLNLTEV